MPAPNPADELLRDILSGRPKSVYLLYGEEDYLVEKTCQKLVEGLLPPEVGTNNLFILNGESVTWEALYETCITCPLFPGPKVVVIRNARFLEPSRPVASEITRIRELARSNSQEGARQFAGLAARLGWDMAGFLKDGDDGKWRIFGEDRSWVKQLAEICLSQGLEVKGAQGIEDGLINLLSQGLPEGHILFIIARQVDERRRLFKLIESLGKVVSFPAAAGERQKRERAMAAAEGILKEAGKKLTAGAWNLLGLRTGYDLRETLGQVEKLIVLTGERGVITEDDVKAVVEKTQEESIFKLTGALARKDEREALKVLDDLLTQGTPPLVCVSLLGRELGLLLRTRLIMEAKDIRPKDMDLAHFQRHFFHLLKEESPELGSLHPFVAFNLMKNAARFERDELIEAIAHLAKTDREMKTSGGDHRLPLERFILSI